MPQESSPEKVEEGRLKGDHLRGHERLPGRAGRERHYAGAVGAQSPCRARRKLTAKKHQNCDVTNRAGSLPHHHPVGNLVRKSDPHS